jgi:hypothetical protein
MYQVHDKGDRHGRVLSAVRRAAVSKGFSETEVDDRLAAVRNGRTSIIEHILNVHRDKVTAAAKNLRGPLAEITPSLIQAAHFRTHATAY